HAMGGVVKPNILLSTGDIFASGCEALVSPVDCTGAQGAGLALAFVRRFPRQTAWYRDHARRGCFLPGSVYHETTCADEDRRTGARLVLERCRRGGESLVLFATTKRHWRNPS